MEYAEASLRKQAAPPLPLEIGYLWQWFCALSDGRQVGTALNPIAWPDIEAFVRVMLVDLRAWDVSILRKLDRLALNVWGEQAGQPPGGGQDECASDGAVSIHDGAGLRRLFGGIRDRMAAKRR